MKKLIQYLNYIKSIFCKKQNKAQRRNVQEIFVAFEVTNKTNKTIECLEFFNPMWILDPTRWKDGDIDTKEYAINCGYASMKLGIIYAGIMSQPFILKNITIKSSNSLQMTEVISFKTDFINGDTNIRRFIPIIDAYNTQTDKMHIPARHKNICIDANTQISSRVQPNTTFTVILHGEYVSSSLKQELIDSYR